jgi:hypothetical protein
MYSYWLYYSNVDITRLLVLFKLLLLSQVVRNIQLTFNPW